MSRAMSVAACHLEEVLPRQSHNHDSGSVFKLAVVGENSFNKCPTVYLLAILSAWQPTHVPALKPVPNTSQTLPLRLTTNDRQRIVLAIRIICSRS